MEGEDEVTEEEGGDVKELVVRVVVVSGCCVAIVKVVLHWVSALAPSSP